MLVTPEQLGRGKSEHAQQCALFAWAAQNEAIYPELRWLHAIPNGGSRGETRQEAQKVGGYMKAEGLRKGVSDVCLPVARGGYFGMYLELKKPGKIDDTSAEQKEFLQFANAQGYIALVADNWQTCKEYIEFYLNQPKTQVRANDAT